MKHITAIALFIAATVITAGKAIAQDYAVRATIPFSFSVNGKQLPAGNYTLGTDVTSPRILKISDRTQHANACGALSSDFAPSRWSHSSARRAGPDTSCASSNRKSNMGDRLPSDRRRRRAAPAHSARTNAT